MPITVAMHTELELRGSRASSFIPALKSLVGGTLDCTHTHAHTKGHLITVMQFEWKAQQQNKVIIRLNTLSCNPYREYVYVLNNYMGT